MRTISAMYQYSGGTKYNHKCNECKYCTEAMHGKKIIHKCLLYINTGGPEIPWNPSWIACKLFSGKTIKENHPEDTLDGQMSFGDFPEVLP